MVMMMVVVMMVMMMVMKIMIMIVMMINDDDGDDQLFKHILFNQPLYSFHFYIFELPRNSCVFTPKIRDKTSL